MLEKGAQAPGQKARPSGQDRVGSLLHPHSPSAPALLRGTNEPHLLELLLLLFSCSVVSSSLRPHGLYVTHQVPLSMGFPRQQHWSGCHFLLQGIFPTQGLNLRLLHWQTGSLLLSQQGSPSSVPTCLHYLLPPTSSRLLPGQHKPVNTMLISQLSTLVFAQKEQKK